jgi:aspartate-semialdehyde dehydrogenase
MMRVGFVGWRGMVGSVLIQRMLEENDFEHIDPVFFSTSSAGGSGPSVGKPTGPLRDAHDAKAFDSLDAIVTCQGGDWTKPMYTTLRDAGWDGYWIDAASTLRMADDAVIVLDPVNRAVIDKALDSGVKNFIGGNCTVSLMMMAIAGLLKNDLVEWMTCMTYQSASGAGAQNMRELLQQMGEVHLAAKELLGDPGSSILDIDREVAGIFRDERSHRAFRRSVGRKPDSGVPRTWAMASAGRNGRAVRRPTRSSAARPTLFRSSRFACASAQCAATARR